MKTSDRNGIVVAAHAVRNSDALMLITSAGQMIRMAISDTRTISRNTQGVRLDQLDEGDHVVSATTVEPEDESPAVATAVDEKPALKLA